VTALAVQIARASALFKIHDVRLGRRYPRRALPHSPSDRPVGGAPGAETRLAFQANEGLRATPASGSPPPAWPSGESTRPLPTLREPFSNKRSSSRARDRGAGRGPGTGEVQKRSYPTLLAATNAPRAGKASSSWICPATPAHRRGSGRSAERGPCPSGVTTVILGATQLALQVHESCGHPIELDGCSAPKQLRRDKLSHPEKFGSFRYGSDAVNLTATPPSPAVWAPSAGTTRACLPSACPSYGTASFAAISPHARRPAAS